MIQRALVMRAKRMIDNQDKSYRQLVGLLAQTAGFSWYPCLKEVDIGFDPAYVTPTSDPGWHLGFKQKVAEGNLAGQGNMLDSVLRSIRSKPSGLIWSPPRIASHDRANPCRRRHRSQHPPAAGQAAGGVLRRAHRLRRRDRAGDRGEGAARPGSAGRDDAGHGRVRDLPPAEGRSGHPPYPRRAGDRARWPRRPDHRT